MTTTAISAEILVVGLQAVAWIAILTLAVFGTAWVDLAAVDQWATLVTILVLATAYAIGVLIALISERMVAAVATNLHGRQATDAAGSPAIAEMRMEVLHSSAGMMKFLDSQHSGLRVARGTILNTSLATPVVVAFLVMRTDASVGWLAVTFGVGVVVLAASVYANERIHRAYVRNLKRAYQILRIEGPAVETRTS